MSKLQKLKAMQEHIDSQFINPVSKSQQDSNPVSQLASNFIEENLSINTSRAEDQPPAKQQPSKPAKQEVSKPVSQLDSKTATQQTSKPAIDDKVSNYGIKKTFYITPEIAKILKYIKFSNKMDESEFTNKALEMLIEQKLGVDWRTKFADFLV